MTQAHFLADAGVWLINIAFFVSAAFPAVTAAFWPWWTSAWGRNIIALEGCIGVTLLPGVLFRDFGIDNIGLRWVSTLAFTLVIVVIVWRAVLIWLTQRQGLDWASAGTREEGPLRRSLFFAFQQNFSRALGLPLLAVVRVVVPDGGVSFKDGFQGFPRAELAFRLAHGGEVLGDHSPCADVGPHGRDLPQRAGRFLALDVVADVRVLRVGHADDLAGRFSGHLLECANPRAGCTLGCRLRVPLVLIQPRRDERSQVIRHECSFPAAPLPPPPSPSPPGLPPRHARTAAAPPS